VDECAHGLERAWCSYCGHASEGSVWISDGGAAFHKDRDCEALADGQRRVERWGGQASEVHQVAVATALRLSRQPCLVCTDEVRTRS
jgi:hypothetical protein